jgi:hypothetical protein
MHILNARRAWMPRISPSLAGLDPAIPIGATIGMPSRDLRGDSMRRLP